MVYHNILDPMLGFPMLSRNITRIAAILVAVLFSTLPVSASAAPVVAATIKPLQFIAAAITDGVTEPRVLVPESQSYHHFIVRPSTVRLLREADLVLWVGPELETYLADSINDFANATVQALAVSGLAVHYLPDIETTGETNVPESGQHAGHQHHGVSGIDPHIWLNTQNAEQVATVLAEQLSAIDPANEARYLQNLATFRAELQLIRESVVQRLQPYLDRPYAVYHDAFQYFEQEFGLSHQLVIANSDEIQPGVRKLMSLRDAFASQELSCLMEDVTSQESTINTALGRVQLNRIKADTTGQNLTSSPRAYIQLINDLGLAFAQCFSDH